MVVLATVVFVSFFGVVVFSTFFSETTFLSVVPLGVTSVFLVVVTFTSFLASVPFLSADALVVVFTVSVLVAFVGVFVWANATDDPVKANKLSAIAVFFN